jgi:tripartite-type tricarboxylate transporter receptor subunit TctC
MKFFAILSFVCACVIPTQVQAQDYPSRTIQFVVPYTPGTTGDMLARLLGQKNCAALERSGRGRQQGWRQRHDWH